MFRPSDRYRSFVTQSDFLQFVPFIFNTDLFRGVHSYVAPAGSEYVAKRITVWSTPDSLSSAFYQDRHLFQ